MTHDPAIDHDGPQSKDVRKNLVTTEDIAWAADKLVTARVLHNLAKDGQMSLSGKMAALTERAKDFTAKTGEVLDGISEKITAAEVKRDEAAGKHHAYYDDIIAGVDESVSVIDKLSNGPLSEGGKG